MEQYTLVSSVYPSGGCSWWGPYESKEDAQIDIDLYMSDMSDCPTASIAIQTENFTQGPISSVKYRDVRDQRCKTCNEISWGLSTDKENCWSCYIKTEELYNGS